MLQSPSSPLLCRTRRPPPTSQNCRSPNASPIYQHLVRMIREATRPVISDDMVLILRSGKQVQWEPAIFAELASTGLWDQRPFVNMIEITCLRFLRQRRRSGRLLSDCAEAMRRAYPITRHIANFSIHFEASPLRREVRFSQSVFRKPMSQNGTSTHPLYEERNARCPAPALKDVG